MTTTLVERVLPKGTNITLAGVELTLLDNTRVAVDEREWTRLMNPTTALTRVAKPQTSRE